MKTKLLLYCTQNGKLPLDGLVWDNEGKGLVNKKLFPYAKGCPEHERLRNGKIVVECECEVVDKLEPEFYAEEPLYKDYGTYQALKRVCLEQLELVDYDEDWCDRDTLYCNEDYLNEEDEKNNKFLKESCLSGKQLQKYFNGVDTGYALHLINIKAFEKPLELSEVEYMKKYKNCSMCPYGYGNNGDEYCHCDTCEELKPLTKAPQNAMWVWYKGQKYCLISIRPEWLCKIANGEKTIEVRRKILKGMM